jgi:hypothetical protein
MFGGIALVAFQITVFPKILAYFGVTRALRVASLAFAVASMIAPLASLHGGGRGVYVRPRARALPVVSDRFLQAPFCLVYSLLSHFHMIKRCVVGYYRRVPLPPGVVSHAALRWAVLLTSQTVKIVVLAVLFTTVIMVGGSESSRVCV